MIEKLTISDIAQRTGLRPSAIRYYESLNLLPMPQRVSGQRRYEPGIVERLTFIQTSRRLGFSLTEIQSLLREQSALMPLSERWQLLARKKLQEVQMVIQEGQKIQQRLEEGMGCTCADLDDCIDCVLARCQG